MTICLMVVVQQAVVLTNSFASLPGQPPMKKNSPLPHRPIFCVLAAGQSRQLISLQLLSAALPPALGSYQSSHNWQGCPFFTDTYNCSQGFCSMVLTNSFATLPRQPPMKKNAFGSLNTDDGGPLHMVIQGIPKTHCGRPRHFKHKTILANLTKIYWVDVLMFSCFKPLRLIQGSESGQVSQKSCEPKQPRYPQQLYLNWVQ